MHPAAKLILSLSDNALAAALQELLGEKYDVQSSPAKGQISNLESADLIILDHQQIPVSELKLHHSGPVIMLGDMEADADATLSKPFRFNELLIRLENLLNSHAAPRQIGPWSFDLPGKRLIGSAGQPDQMLTEKEAEILEYLLDTDDQPVTREELLQQVWGYQAGITTHTLETHIYRLRQKIENDPADARILITVPGGYQLRP